MMVQSDWTYGRITKDEVFDRARQYEAYMLGRPLLATDSLANSDAQGSGKVSRSAEPVATRFLRSAPR
jgi:hypothetical protein